MVLLATDRMDSLFSPRCVWVNGPIIVGAGPSGLAVAASLREQGVPLVVLERADCIASLWQRRTYDRLKLHFPKQFIDYLENYAAKFDIKTEFNHTVLSARFDETSGLWRRPPPGPRPPTSAPRSRTQCRLPPPRVPDAVASPITQPRRRRPSRR